MTPPHQSEACKTRGSQIARERAQWATGARQDGIMVRRMCIGIPQPQPTMARIQDTTKVGPRIAFKYFPCPITIWYTSTHPHSSAEAICQWDRAQYTPSQCSASVAPERHTGAGDSKKTKLIIVTLSRFRPWRLSVRSARGCKTFKNERKEYWQKGMPRKPKKTRGSVGW